MNYRRYVIRIIALAVVIVLLAVIPLMLVGCEAPANACEGESTIYAILVLPDGEKIEGVVDAWYYYSNGLVRVTVDDVLYTTHGTNVTLITK